MNEKESVFLKLSEKLGVLGILRASFCLIKKNAYCQIYRAFLTYSKKPVIIKIYRSDKEGFRLAKVEYQGLEHYSHLAGLLPGMVASLPLKIVQEPDLNVLVFECFSGYPLTSLFRRAIFSSEARKKLLCIVERLCFYLQSNLEFCQQQGLVNDGLTNFFADYMHYCSRSLEKHLFGRFLCRNFVRETEQLCREFAAQSLEQSSLCRIHGDFVPANILINEKEEICLIDFANSQANGHFLFDVYGFLRSIQLFSFCPAIYQPVQALFAGLLNNGKYSQLEQRFFYEFHRRRWLWLKISSLQPLRQLEFYRALLTPFDAG